MGIKRLNFTAEEISSKLVAVDSKADIVNDNGVYSLKVGNTEITEEQLATLKPQIREFKLVDEGGDDYMFEFEVGMTWADFANSKYNTFAPATDAQFNFVVIEGGEEVTAYSPVNGQHCRIYNMRDFVVATPTELIEDATDNYYELYL